MHSMALPGPSPCKPLNLWRCAADPEPCQPLILRGCAGGLGRQGELPLPTERLREFLPAAAELARQRHGAVQTPRQVLDMMRLTLRMGRQVLPLTPGSSLSLLIVVHVLSPCLDARPCCLVPLVPRYASGYRV